MLATEPGLTEPVPGRSVSAGSQIPPMFRKLPMPKLGSAIATRGQRIRDRGGDPCQGVAVDMRKRLSNPGDLQHALLFVRPGSVVVDDDVHAVAARAKRPIEEGVGQNPVKLGPHRCRHFELFGVGLGRARGKENLASRDTERERHRVRRRLPEPISHLVVECRQLRSASECGCGSATRRTAAGRSSENLWAEGRSAPRTRRVPCPRPLDADRLPLRPPMCPPWGQRTKVRQGVGVTDRLGVDVGPIRIGRHGRDSCSAPRSVLRTSTTMALESRRGAGQRSKGRPSDCPLARMRHARIFGQE